MPSYSGVFETPFFSATGSTSKFHRSGRKIPAGEWRDGEGVEKKRHRLEIVAGLGEFEVLDAAAEEALLGEFFDEGDLGGDEDGGLAGSVGDGDFDEGLHMVPRVALEAQAAFGHVLAGDDVVFALGMSNAGGVGDSDARVLAAVGGWGGGLFRKRGRHGEDGGKRLTVKVPDRVWADGENSGLRRG